MIPRDDPVNRSAQASIRPVLNHRVLLTTYDVFYLEAFLMFLAHTPLGLPRTVTTI